MWPYTDDEVKFVSEAKKEEQPINVSGYTEKTCYMDYGQVNYQIMTLTHMDMVHKYF